jgi:four helix bundle protein
MMPRSSGCDAVWSGQLTRVNREDQVGIHSYMDLEVWKLSVELAVKADVLADHLLRTRRYAMADQLLRASLSVSSNIAEGNGRVHRAEYAHHVSMARGSLYEVASVLHVAIRTNRLTETQCAEALKLVNSIGRMLMMLLRALYRKPPQSPSP